jgi:hypothetical protein
MRICKVTVLYDTDASAYIPRFLMIYCRKTVLDEQFYKYNIRHSYCLNSQYLVVPSSAVITKVSLMKLTLPLNTQSG